MMIKRGVPEKHFDQEESEKLEEKKVGMVIPKVVDRGNGKESEDGLDMVKQ